MADHAVKEINELPNCKVKHRLIEDIKGIETVSERVKETLSKLLPQPIRNQEQEQEQEQEQLVGGASAPADEGFAFKGSVIRLKEPQYRRWRQIYSRIPDFDAALQKADDYYSVNRPPAGKWFFKVSSWLEAENSKYPAKGADTHDEFYRSLGVEV